MSRDDYIHELAMLQRDQSELRRLIHEEKHGKYDQAPLLRLLDFSAVLNETAKKDKRNALFFSLICVFYYVLDIKVTSIAGGIAIGDPSNYLPLLLLITATYFSVSFLVRVLATIKPLVVRVVVYDLLKSKHLDNDLKKHLKHNQFLNLHAKAVLYEALAIHKLDKKYLKGNFLTKGDVDKRAEFLFKTDQKAGEQSASDHVYYPLVRKSVWRAFFRPAILLELFMPWLVNLTAISSYLYHSL